MKLKKILLVFNCLLLIKLPVMHAQSVMIGMIGNDCIKCKAQLQPLLRDLHHIPQFFVFPKAYEQDSATIRKQILQQMEGNIVYDDTYTMDQKVSISTVLYVDHNGRVVYKKPVSDFSHTDVKIIDSLYAADFRTKTHKPFLEYFKDGWHIEKNLLTGKVKADSAGVINTLEIDSSLLSRCRKVLDNTFPGYYEYTLSKMKIIPESYLTPTISAFSMDKGVAYYLVTIPYLRKPGKEDIANGFNDGVIIAQSLLVKKDRSGKTDIFPIMENNSGPDSEAYYTLVNNSFVVHGDAFYFFQYPDKKAEQIRERTYISRYILKNDRVAFDKRLNCKYPDMLFTKKIGYTLTPAFFAVDYPYYAPMIGNTVANLETGEDLIFEPGFSVDYDIMDASFFQKLGDGQTFPPIENLGLFHDRQRNNVYVLSKVKEVYHMSVFKVSGKQLSFVRSVSLPARGLSVAPYAVFDFDAARELLSYEDAKGKMRSISIHLL